MFEGTASDVQKLLLDLCSGMIPGSASEQGFKVGSAALKASTLPTVPSFQPIHLRICALGFCLCRSHITGLVCKKPVLFGPRSAGFPLCRTVCAYRGKGQAGWGDSQGNSLCTHEQDFLGTTGPSTFQFVFFFRGILE